VNLPGPVYVVVEIVRIYPEVRSIVVDSHVGAPVGFYVRLKRISHCKNGVCNIEISSTKLIFNIVEQDI